MKYLIALAFVAIVLSLGSALFFMLRGRQAPAQGARMARALAFRVGFSILLFVCILISWKMGWIQPTGIAPGR